MLDNLMGSGTENAIRGCGSLREVVDTLLNPRMRKSICDALKQDTANEDVIQVIQHFEDCLQDPERVDTVAKKQFLSLTDGSNIALQQALHMSLQEYFERNVLIPQEFVTNDETTRTEFDAKADATAQYHQFRKGFFTNKDETNQRLFSSEKLLTLVTDMVTNNVHALKKDGVEEYYTHHNHPDLRTPPHIQKPKISN